MGDARRVARSRLRGAGTRVAVLFRIIDGDFRARAPARTNRVDNEHEYHFIEHEYD